MVGIGVIDEARLGERRHCDQHGARPVYEEVDRLDIAGIIVAADSSKVIRIAVSRHNEWFCWTAWMMFFANASNSGGVEVPGWLSSRRSGLTKETAGSVPPLTSEKNEGRS